MVCCAAYRYNYTGTYTIQVVKTPHNEKIPPMRRDLFNASGNLLDNAPVCRKAYTWVQSGCSASPQFADEMHGDPNNQAHYSNPCKKAKNSDYQFNSSKTFLFRFHFYLFHLGSVSSKMLEESFSS